MTKVDQPCSLITTAPRSLCCVRDTDTTNANRAPPSTRSSISLMRVSIRTVGKAPEMLHGQLQLNSQQIPEQSAISNDRSWPISDAGADGDHDVGGLIINSWFK